jgi:hypothetical protein
MRGSFTRVLAAISLVFYVSYALALQHFALPSDSKLAAVLSWRHYGSVLPPLVILYGDAAAAVLMTLALLGITLGIRSSRWALLIGYLLALPLAGFGGLFVMTALPRFLGGVAQLCATATLTMCFFVADRHASSSRIERIRD